jgi:signal transduction histidine kinase
LRRVSEAGAARRPVWFGLRPRLLAALVATAIVTLAAAAFTLLTPLKSQLRRDSVNQTNTAVIGAQTEFGYIPLTTGKPDIPTVKKDALALGKANDATVVVWHAPRGNRTLTTFYTTDPDLVIPDDLARAAFSDKHAHTHRREANGVLEVAIRYRAQPVDPSTPGSHGAVYVLELVKRLNYVSNANAVVQSAFLKAALVGLVVAIVLGIGFSSRLLRRLRLLQDASRSLDEHDLSTLVVPHDTVSDEIGELARGFATMHARLRQQEDARRAFVATASHELRTPLTSLDGMLELLADDLEREPIDLADARNRVASAQQQSRRLAGLASDLLDLSRLDALVELRSEPVELGELARAVTAEFDTRARERDITLVLDQAGGQSWAQGDPGSVARIVRILLDNALRVAPPHTTIEIRIGGANGEPTIEVSDEGPGVPLDESELIFERFQRGRGRSDEGGFGLGLAIGSELASRMGGALELTGAHPGATFRLTLTEAHR